MRTPNRPSTRLVHALAVAALVGVASPLAGCEIAGAASSTLDDAATAHESNAACKGHIDLTIEGYAGATRYESHCFGNEAGAMGGGQYESTSALGYVHEDDGTVSVVGCTGFLPFDASGNQQAGGVVITMDPETGTGTFRWWDKIGTDWGTDADAPGRVLAGTLAVDADTRRIVGELSGHITRGDQALDVSGEFSVCQVSE